MSIRNIIDQHPKSFAVVSILAVLSVAIYLVYPWLNAHRPISVQRAYYYDLRDGSLFTSEISLPPPIVRPGEPAGASATGVRAYVFSCATCGESERVIGYLLKLSDSGRRKYDESPAAKLGFFAAPPPLATFTSMPGFGGDQDVGLVVASVSAPDHWAPLSDTKSRSLIESVKGLCGKHWPRPCEP